MCAIRRSLTWNATIATTSSMTVVESTAVSTINTKELRVVIGGDNGGEAGGSGCGGGGGASNGHSHPRHDTSKVL